MWIKLDAHDMIVDMKWSTHREEDMTGSITALSELSGICLLWLVALML